MAYAVFDMSAIHETSPGQRGSGDGAADPTLLGRLPNASTPVLVVWGAADRIVPPAHGTAYAEALPDARFVIIEDGGHLPQLETPAKVRDLVVEFAVLTDAFGRSQSRR